MEISKNLSKAYLALITDLWSRQRILGLELNHIQHNSIESLDRDDLLERLNENTFYMYMDAVDLIILEPEKKDNGNNKIKKNYENVNLGQKYAERIYYIAGNLQIEVLKDHQLLRILIDGFSYHKNRNKIANDICPKLYKFISSVEKISVLDWNFDTFLDEITLRFDDNKEYKSKNSSDIDKYLKKHIDNILLIHKEVDQNDSNFKKAFNVLFSQNHISNNKETIKLDYYPFSGLDFLLGNPDDKYTVEKKDFRYFYYTVITLRTKISTFSEELGILTKRVSELLRQNNPNQMGIAGFQRQEYPFYDLFFRTFADQTFRDLFIFCKDKDFLNCPYPYKDDKVASLIHIYTHDHVSSTRSMVREEHQLKWKNWLYSNKKFVMKNGSNAVAVLNSFYTELPTSIPIFTHELAHHVIQEFVGKYARPELFTQRDKHGCIGSFFRAYFFIIHRFLPQEATTEGSFLHTEVLADLLAATRLGTSYLYAWIMEMPGSSPLDYIHTLDEFNSILRENICRIAEQETPKIHNAVPEDYIRGIFLVELIFALYGNEESKGNKKNIQDIELANAFSEHLNIVLKIRYRSNPELIESWKSLSYYARRVLYRSGFVKHAKKFHEFFKKSKREEDSYFSDSQILTEEYRSILEDLLSGIKGEPNDNLKDEISILFTKGENLPSEAVDLSWRISWIAASCAQTQATNRRKDFAKTEPIRNQFRTISKLMLIENIAREDYMAKVMGLSDIWRIIDNTNFEIIDQNKDKNKEKAKINFIATGIKGSYNSTFKMPQRNKDIDIFQIISRNDPLKIEDENVKLALNKSNHKHKHNSKINILLAIQDCNNPYTIPLNFCLKVKHDFTYKKTNLKVLELFRFSPSMTSGAKKNTFSDKFEDQYSYFDSKFKSNYGRTLGFYDFFVLHEYWPHSGQVYRNDSYPYLKAVQAYSRRRTLVPFKILFDMGKEKDSNKRDIFGFILIRLKMRSLRLVFLSWLTNIIKSNDKEYLFLYESFLDIYMSQGSEDFVFLLDASADEQDIFRTIQYLGDNPLVEKTETILTREVFKTKDKKLNFNFLIKVSNGGLFFEKVIKEYAVDGRITLTQLNGEMDIRICLGTKVSEKDRMIIFENIRKSPYVQKVLTDVGYNHLSAKC